MLRKLNQLNGGGRTLRGTLVFSLTLQLMLPWNLRANPAGGNVVAGQANIQGGAGTLTVNQLSQRAIINWQDFSIAQGELTKFVQPNSASAVLNRVVGSNLSGIYGTLQANGQVYLINPNGIVIGPTGVVNTAGFVASTLDVDNSQFLAGGDLTFKGNSTAKVINMGKIGASEHDVILIAQEVENHGEMTAPKGTASLAASQEVLVKASGQERIFVQAGKGRVSNKGLIEAATAELKAAGGNEYALAINNEGTIRATQFETRGGRIFLSAKSGNISHSGSLKATKSRTAEKIRSSEIADKGFVEIVTPHGVILTGGINTQGGMLVIDPDNVTITSGGPDTTANTISNTYLESLLAVNGVELYTDSGQPTGGLHDALTGNTASGDISVEGAITWSSGYSLVLNAYNDLIVLAPITATGGGSLGLGAGVRRGSENTYSDPGKVILNGAITLHAGSLSVYNNEGISQTAALTVGGSTFVHAGLGPVTLGHTGNDFIGKFSLITGSSTAVLVHDTNDLDLDIVSVGGNLTLRANGSILGNSAHVASQGGRIILNANRDSTGGGRIDLNLSSINSNGGKVVLGGGNNPETTAAIGTGTGSDSEKVGIFLVNSSIQAGSGQIIMRGQGVGGTDFADGIYIGGATTIGNATTTGKITIVGTGGNGTNDSTGVMVESSFITSQSGDISITGFSGMGTAQYNRGVVIRGGSIIESTGTGGGAAQIAINGTAQGSTYGGNGVALDNNAEIRSRRGNISITGQGAGTDTNNHGITMGGGAKVLSTGSGANAATITLQGTGSAAGASSTGVLLLGDYSLPSQTAIRSTAGAIAVTGQGGEGAGVYFGSGAVIESLGSGANAATITVYGTAGNSSTQGRGVWISSSGSGVASKDGDILIRGQGGSGSATSNHGIYLNTGAEIKTTGSAKVNLIAIGQGGSSDFAAVGTPSFVGGSTATGNIVVNANSVDWGAGLLKFDTSGTVTIQPRSAGTTIGVGGLPSTVLAPGELNLDNAELSIATLSNRIGKVIIGNETAGLLTAYSFTLPASFKLITGGDLRVAGILATSKDIEFNFGQSGAAAFTVEAGAFVTANFPSVAKGGSGADTFNIFGSYYGNLEGKGGADVFNITDTSNRLESIDGGNGNNTVDYSGITDSVTASVAKLLNIDKLIGNTSWLTLEGTSGDDLFEITGENKGQIGAMTFTDVSTLLGGEGADRFKFTTNGSKLTGNISGGNGNDVLDFSAITVRPVLRLYSDNAGTVNDRLGSFDNIDEVQAGSAGGRVQGTAMSDVFRFNGGNVTTSGVKFIGFDQVEGRGGGDIFRFNGGTFNGTVEGNDGHDTFVFNGGKLNGDLKGGSGLNTVDLRGAGGVTVTLNGNDHEGSFRNTNFKGVDLFLGSGSDVLEGSDFADYFFFVTQGVSAYDMGFENFGEVRGGRGADMFDFYSGLFKGSVYGGRGSDVFTIYGGGLTGTLYGGRGDDGFLFIPVLTGDFNDYGNATYNIVTGGGNDGIVAVDFFAAAGHSFTITANSLTRDSGLKINYDLDNRDALILKTSDFDDTVTTNFFAFTQALDGSGHNSGDRLIIPGMALSYPAGVISRAGFGDIIYQGFEMGAPDPVVPPTPDQPVTPGRGINFGNYLSMWFNDFQSGQASDDRDVVDGVMDFTGSGQAKLTFGSKGGKVKGSMLHVSSGEVE